LRTMSALILVVIVAVCLIWPNRVDRALDRVAPTSTGKGVATNQIWNSVVSVLTSEDVESEQVASSAPPSGGTVLQQSESVTTGSAGRIVLTEGHDILEMDPETTIFVGKSGPEATATIVKLIDGTIHVKAATRADGRTFSVETQYLVATVKGTRFDVTTTEGGAAVSVTEGLVSVRSPGSSDGVDVTPGNTAVVSAADGGAPMVGPTPAGGSPAAIEAVKAQSASAGAGPSAPDSNGGGDSSGQ